MTIITINKIDIVEKLAAQLDIVQAIFSASSEVVIDDALMTALNDIEPSTAPDDVIIEIEDASPTLDLPIDADEISQISIEYTGTLEDTASLQQSIFVIFEDDSFDFSFSSLFDSITSEGLAFFSNAFFSALNTTLSYTEEDSSIESPAIYSESPVVLSEYVAAPLKATTNDSSNEGSASAENNKNSAFSGNDDLRGYNENDELYGYGGDDTIKGGNGDDLISGGQGSDVLFGNNGADLFTWASDDVNGQSFDTIKDFSTTEGDSIDISDVLSFTDGSDDMIADFVRFADADHNNDANLEIRASGEGEWTAIIEIAKGASLDSIETMVDEGALII